MVTFEMYPLSRMGTTGGRHANRVNGVKGAPKNFGNFNSRDREREMADVAGGVKILREGGDNR